MKIKLTLRRPGWGETDLVVTCDSSVTVGALANQLFSSDPAGQSSGTAAGYTLCLPEHGDRQLRADLTVADAGLRSGQVISLMPSGLGGFDAGAPAAAVMSIQSGPDRGQEFPLVSGANVVGRGREAQVRLTDPMVSRSHVRLNITDEAELIDLGSANGTLVAGEPTMRKMLRSDDVIEIGDTTFVVRLLNTFATQGRVESAAVGFIRSARLVKPYEGRSFEVPDIPVRQQKVRFSVAGLVAPIGMALVMWLFTKQLMSLLFMALSPVMLVGTWLEQTLGNRSTFKREVKAWRADVDDLLISAAEETQVEVEARLIEHPSTRECVNGALQRTNLLWTRRKDAPGFAELRCGLGQQPSRLSFKLPDIKRAPRPLVRELMEKLAPFEKVDDVPIVACLRQQGGLGVAGPRSAAASVARALVAQAVALHSPNELQLCVVASARTSQDWDWVKWLPHTTASRVIASRALADSPNAATALVGELEELITTRAATGSKDDDVPLPVVFLVVEADAPVEFGRLVDLVENGWTHGVYVLWVTTDMVSLPAACRVYVDVRTLTEGGVGYLSTGDMAFPVTVELMEHSDATRWARDMSPITDLATRSDDATDIPRISTFVSMVGKEILSNPQAVIERWTENNSIVSGPYAPPMVPRKAGTLRATIGHTATEPYVLDLRAQGPHALVGGTTGAGKSELLQTWVLGMAANHSPARVNFLLVDYKGGSAFAEAAELPHTVGLVTDLGLSGVHRALASLGAELRRREHLFNQFKAKDLVALEKSNPVVAPPALVIIVDEFAALVTEVPEFVDGVIDVAARGRSLGLHLILATQRPAGVIKDSLRANTNLRLALRVADVDDSNDVLGAPDAAYFDQDVPGRAISKTGPGRLVAFQTAYVGGHTGDVAPLPSIEVETLGFGNPVPWEPPAAAVPVNTGDEESDLKRIVRTIQQAQIEAGLPEPDRPWLPDLATYYNLADRRQVPNQRNDASLVFAIGDDPDNQNQPTITFRPDAVGNLAIYGTGGSGKSTLLRSLAVAAGMTVHGGPCHVYGLDFSSRGLAMIEGMPHVGSVIAGNDDERVQRLIRWLRGVIDERAARYASVNASTITQYRSISGRTTEPRILMLVDGIASFRTTYDGGANYRIWDSFISIASDGRPVGVHVVMTSDQPSGIPPTLAASVQQRVVMRMASDDDYGTLGVPHGILTPASPPGRCLTDGLEAQVVLLGGDPATERASMHSPGWVAPTDAQAQAVNLHLFSVAMRQSGTVSPAAPIQRLPESVPLTALKPVAGCFPLGLESAEFATVQVEASGPFILTGPAGSGISTGLRTIATGLLACPTIDAVYVFSDRPTNLAADPRLHVTIGASKALSAIQELTSQVQAMNEPAADQASGPTRHVAVLLEGLADFAGSEIEYPLSAFLTALTRGGHFMLASGDPVALNSAYQLMAPFKAGRRAMYLQFDSNGPELVSAVYPRARAIDFPVGRGVYAERGHTSVVQMAS